VTTSVPESVVDQSGLLGGAGDRRRGKRRIVIAALVLVVAASGVAVGATDPFRSSGTSPVGVADNATATSTATVRRETISQQTSVPATLGYAGSYGPVNQAYGTYTALPEIGQVVKEGQVLYRVNGSPVILLYGATPAYRTLSEGVTGEDVTELNADLVSLGHAKRSDLSPTPDSFSYWTKVGVESLQASLGETQNGIVTLGQAVFLPSAVRVTSLSGQLGGVAEPGQPVLEGTSTAREVTIDLDAAMQSEVRVGDPVMITLPDGSTIPGLVASVGTVATASSSSSSSGDSGGGGGSGDSAPTVTVEVTPTDPAATGSLDQAPVQVAITNDTAPNALVVPVNALVALSSGGYAVEVVSPAGVHSVTTVTVGLFDDADNLVQVTGPGLSVGQRVVVPATGANG
jgi:hypothetical protein